MPIIETHRAKTVIVLKRSMNTGFTGIENALFFYPNTCMYFGDAKASIQALVAEFKSADKAFNGYKSRQKVLSVW
jgi:NAD(P) transhydrogenase subunit beta